MSASLPPAPIPVLCGDQCTLVMMKCNLPAGHPGRHQAMLGGIVVASWPNVPAPVPVPAQPTAPAPAQPPITPVPSGAPDPDSTTAPDPRPEPIDYTDWISDEDLL